MKSNCFILILLGATLAYGQQWNFNKPDYQQIGIHIADTHSHYYYPTLLERFKKSDTTLTLQEKRHLYYGYIFHPRYAPYERSEYQDSLVQVLRKERQGAEDLEKIIRYGDSVLVGNPFDLRTLNYQLYALEQQRDTEGFEAKMIQSTAIIDALMSSGDGTSKAFSFYVINTSHEYGLLGILGLDFGGSQSLTEHYDYLTVAANDFGIEGLYFDVTPCLNSLQKFLKK